MNPQNLAFLVHAAAMQPAQLSYLAACLSRAAQVAYPASSTQPVAFRVLPTLLDPWTGRKSGASGRLSALARLGSAPPASMPNGNLQNPLRRSADALSLPPRHSMPGSRAGSGHSPQAGAIEMLHDKAASESLTGRWDGPSPASVLALPDYDRRLPSPHVPMDV